MKETLMRVENLTKYYPIQKKWLREKKYVKAVDGISFDVYDGETLALVGESGCGKSTIGRTMMRLIEATSGNVIFQGQDIFNLSREDIRKLRKNMQIVFQDPFGSLNPRMKVKDIIAEPLNAHGIGSRKDRLNRVKELLEIVGLNGEQLDRYPHEFSGGQRQRISIARALAINPKLIVCDEAVSALDVSIQSQILNLLEDLQNEFGLTYLFISHDLNVVHHIADRVGVMYLGKMMELGEVDQIYNKPLHPYTEALLSAIPSPDPGHQRERIILEGDVPSPSSPPQGCRFHTRCPYAEAHCREIEPAFQEIEPGHWVACHFPLKDEAIIT